jgi:uncharacterized membrane-anchored protein
MMAIADPVDKARARAARRAEGPPSPTTPVQEPGMAEPARLAPTDHPLRDAVYRELHARPSESLQAPLRASHVVMITGAGGEDAGAGRRHVAALCDRLGAPPPAADAQHHSVELGSFRLKWERHTEFDGYTVYRRGTFDRPFAEPAILSVPSDWLAALPGHRLAAVHVALLSADHRMPDAGQLEDVFGDDGYVGAKVSGGAATVWSDFRSHGDGWARFLVHDTGGEEGLKPRQAGRLVQRLAEIETYRTTALLALPLARRIAPRLTEADAELADIAARIAQAEDIEDERRLLGRLTALAAEVEKLAAETTWRFRASRAYSALVTRRIEDLREIRIEGLQTVAEFMDRRFGPAMRTCESVNDRLEGLATRIGRAGTLLRTRVDITLEGQNRDLLVSMDRRARLQLRLQGTVEGLSVAAITYYGTGLILHLAEVAQGAGVPIDPEVAAGVMVVPIALGVWVGLRKVRQRLEREDAGADDAGGG